MPLLLACINIKSITQLIIDIGNYKMLGYVKIIHYILYIMVSLLKFRVWRDSMNSNPIYKELVPINISLEHIYLDPNNPRFTEMNWEFISDEDIEKDYIQESTRLKMNQDFSIDKLVMNMEINGYLPIDRIIIRKFSENKYVVLEGNRRICAAKTLYEKYQINKDSVSSEIGDSLKTIPCLQYIGAYNQASWIFQGLRHITGLLEWSAFNKAKLLVTLMEEEGLSLTEVGAKFGLTAFGAGQWARGYYAFNQANESSDYINEINEKAYPYFQELFSRSSTAIREWLAWSEVEEKFVEDMHFNEFLGWLYPRGEDDGDSSHEIKGDWNKRLIQRSSDIRLISFLIKEDKSEFEKFRAEEDLQKAYTRAVQKKYEEEAKQTADPVSELFDSIKICTKALENVPHKIFKDSITKQKLDEALELLEKAISIIKE